MAFLDVVAMSLDERDKRRELDGECFRAVHAEIERGVDRSKTFAQVGRALGIKREDVIAGYWRHVRRKGAT
jgi:hypothetical protein